MARMQEEGLPLQELTNRTPSPRDCKNSAAARAHSPWTAARVKKKGRAANDCILADLAPSSSDNGNHGSTPPAGWSQQAPHGCTPPSQGLQQDASRAGGQQWAPTNTPRDMPVDGTGCSSTEGRPAQEQQQQQQMQMQKATATRRKPRLSGGLRTGASGSIVSSLGGLASSSPSQLPPSRPGQGLRIQVLADDLGNSTSSHKDPPSSSAARLPVCDVPGAAAGAGRKDDNDCGSSSPAADMCSPPACLAPPAGCSLAVALQQLELHSSAGHGNSSSGCHTATTTPTAQQQEQQQQHAFVAHLLGDERAGAAGDVEVLQEQLDKAAEVGDVGEAQQVWGAMCAAGARPDHTFLHSLLRCWQRGGGDPQDAQRLVQQVCAAGGLVVDRTAARLLEAIDMTWQQLAGAGQ